MSCDSCVRGTDNGANPYTGNIRQMALRNQNFRTAIWTGYQLQMTLMCIPLCGEIGSSGHRSVYPGGTGGSPGENGQMQKSAGFSAKDMYRRRGFCARRNLA